VAQGQVLFGHPEQRTVTLSSPPAGGQALSAVTLGSWTRSERAFGHALAIASPGGDAPEDLWIGAPGASTFRGAVLHIEDALANPGGVPDLILLGTSPGDREGTVVQACADLTGDDRTDWVVTAPRFSQPADEEALPGLSNLAGAVYLLESEALDRRSTG
jgi:hypothetical protein